MYQRSTSYRSYRTPPGYRMPPGYRTPPPYNNGDSSYFQMPENTRLIPRVHIHQSRSFRKPVSTQYGNFLQVPHHRPSQRSRSMNRKRKLAPGQLQPFPLPDYRWYRPSSYLGHSPRISYSDFNCSLRSSTPREPHRPWTPNQTTSQTSLLLNYRCFNDSHGSLSMLSDYSSLCSKYSTSTFDNWRKYLAAVNIYDTCRQCFS